MSNPELFVTGGAIILTLLGGFLGTMFVHNTNLYQGVSGYERESVRLVILITSIFLAILIGIFFGILLTWPVEINLTVYSAVVGILIGVLGSIHSNFFVYSESEWERTRFNDPTQSRRHAIIAWISGAMLIVMFVYLLFAFAMI